MNGLRNSKSLVVIGADHRGIMLQKQIADYLASDEQFSFILLEGDEKMRDYPDYCMLLAEKIKLLKGNPQEHRAVWGILCCASGIGMSIGANRYSWIRCLLARNVRDVEMGRRHNDINVLAFGSDYFDADAAMKMIIALVSTPFDEDLRHSRRVRKLSGIGE